MSATEPERAAPEVSARTVAGAALVAGVVLGLADGALAALRVGAVPSPGLCARGALLDALLVVAGALLFHVLKRGAGEAAAVAWGVALLLLLSLRVYVEAIVPPTWSPRGLTLLVAVAAPVAAACGLALALRRVARPAQAALRAAALAVCALGAWDLALGSGDGAVSAAGGPLPDVSRVLVVRVGDVSAEVRAACPALQRLAARGTTVDLGAASAVELAPTASAFVVPARPARTLPERAWAALRHGGAAGARCREALDLLAPDRARPSWVALDLRGADAELEADALERVLAALDDGLRARDLVGSTLVVVALGARPAQLVLANARLLPYGRRVALERPFDLADTARELTGLAAPGSLPQSAATALLADAPAEAPR